MNYYMMGILVGIVVGLILTVIFMKSINRDGKLKTEYDERQKEARGRGYMYGFFATIITNGLLMVLSISCDIEVLGISLYFIPILIGIIAQVTYCVFNDAYVGLNNNMTRFFVGMTFITAFNFFVGIKALTDGELIVDGKFQGAFVNILCGSIFLILIVEMLIKKLIDRNEE